MRLNKLATFSCMSLTLACAGAAKADSFSPGQFITYSQNEWGSGTASSSLLVPDFNSVFASTDDVLVVGVTGVANQYFMTFSSASNVQAYLPDPGTGYPGQLSFSLINPNSSPSGYFGGDVVALTLNIDFNETGYLQGSSSILFGDLVLENLPSYDSALNGLTVSQFLAVANICLSGGSCPDGLTNVADITDSLNISFEPGFSSSFADDYLSLPGSGTPTATPEPSSFLLLASGLASLGFLVERRGRVLRGPP